MILRPPTDAIALPTDPHAPSIDNRQSPIGNPHAPRQFPLTSAPHHPTLAFANRGFPSGTWPASQPQDRGFGAGRRYHSGTAGARRRCLDGVGCAQPLEAVTVDDLLVRLVSQLDTLVLFLALSREEAFTLIRQSESEWFSEEQRAAVPAQFGVYRTQVTHAAFLLGYSYFEAFLSDLVRRIYQRRPRMLPLDKELKFRELLGLRSYRKVLLKMIDKEVFALFHEPMQTILEYFERKLKLAWPPDSSEEMVRASLVRNCIVHNMARATPQLAAVSRYQAQQEIRLEVDEVHGMGIAARGVA